MCTVLPAPSQLVLAQQPFHGPHIYGLGAHESEGLVWDAARDLDFLMWSYIPNMLTVIGALWVLKHGPWKLTGRGLWWCLLQFQIFRLIVNGVRLLGKNSPLRASRTL